MPQAPTTAGTTPGGWLPRRDIPIVVFVFLVNLLLVSPSLKVGFDSINPHDEAKYIDSGRSLLDLQIRDPAWGPLVAVVYAPFHLLFQRSVDWLVWEAFAGRLLLFTLLWASLFYLATKFRQHAHPFVMAGILFLSVSFFPILENQSDALYLACAIAGLAKLLEFRRTLSLRDLALTSALVALAALARIESILLLGVLVVVALLIARRRKSLLRALAAAILPALGILAAYVLLIVALSGPPDLSGKSWNSFEMNQPVVTGEDPAEVVARLYGSAEENGNSVVRAVLRNPGAFVQRIAYNARSLPDWYLDFFGRRLGMVILLAAAWGAYALLRRRDPWDLLIMVAWAAPAAVSLAFLARHFVPQSSYLPLVLAAVGIVYPLAQDSKHAERLVFGLSAAGLAVYGLLDNKLAILVGGVILFSAAALVWLLRSRRLTREPAMATPLLLVFAGGLILRGPFNFPNYTHFGASAAERAVHYMAQNLPAGSRVVTAVPLPAIAARMQDVPPAKLADSASAEALCHGLRRLDISAIYVDSALRRDHPALMEAAGQLLGNGLDVRITADPGSFQVFVVSDPCLAPAE